MNNLQLTNCMQLVVLVFFSKISGSKSLTARKFINLSLLLQYVPRIFRIYLSAKDLTFDSLTRRVWVRGAFFFFLYIIFGHVSIFYIYIYWDSSGYCNWCNFDILFCVKMLYVVVCYINHMRGFWGRQHLTSYRIICYLVTFY